MDIVPFYCELFLIYCYVNVSVVITMSVHKTAGSHYFGIMPPKHAKVTHQTLPPPDDEAYQLISDASYYYNQVNNQVYNFFKQYFGTSDEQDPQIDQGVYECKSGDCRKIALNQQQMKTFHEKFKGTKFQTGNALTAKVEQMDNTAAAAADPQTSS